jgi:hypothetical protein
MQVGCSDLRSFNHASENGFHLGYDCLSAVKRY